MQQQSEKIQLAKSILDTKSDAILKQVRAVFDSYKTDLWDELSDYQKSVVKAAKLELRAGKGRSHQLVMKDYKKWLSK